MTMLQHSSKIINPLRTTTPDLGYFEGVTPHFLKTGSKTIPLHENNLRFELNERIRFNLLIVAPSNSLWIMRYIILKFRQIC